MKKKGFTLIELLAVIVILAVIALIVTPIVTGIISQAKISANARSVEGHIKDVQYIVLEVAFKENGNINKYDGTYPINNVNLLNKLSSDGYRIQASDKIECSTYTVANGTVTEATGCTETEWGKTYNYTNTGGAVVSGGGSNSQQNNNWNKFYYFDEEKYYETWTYELSSSLNPDWNLWIQEDTTTNNKEICAKFSNGNVCTRYLTADEYNSNVTCASVNDCTITGIVSDLKTSYENAGAECWLDDGRLYCRDLNSDDTSTCVIDGDEVVCYSWSGVACLYLFNDGSVDAGK